MRGVELHHFDRRVDQPRPRDPHLLPRQPSHPVLGGRAAVAAAAAAAAAILGRLLVEALEGAREAEGGRLEEEPAGLEGEEKRARRGEAAAPARERARAERQRVLELTLQLGVELAVEEEGREALGQQRSLGGADRRELGGGEQVAPVRAQVAEQPQEVEDGGRRVGGGDAARRLRAQRRLQRVGVDGKHPAAAAAAARPPPPPAPPPPPRRRRRRPPPPPPPPPPRRRRRRGGGTRSGRPAPTSGGQTRAAAAARRRRRRPRPQRRRRRRLRGRTASRPGRSTLRTASACR